MVEDRGIFLRAYVGVPESGVCSRSYDKGRVTLVELTECQVLNSLNRRQVSAHGIELLCFTVENEEFSLLLPYVDAPHRLLLAVEKWCELYALI
jgi:hypothetical protein